MFISKTLKNLIIAYEVNFSIKKYFYPHASPRGNCALKRKEYLVFSTSHVSLIHKYASHIGKLGNY